MITKEESILFSLMDEKELNNLFIKSVSDNILDHIKFIMSDKNLYVKLFPTTLTQGFRKACCRAHIEIIDYMIDNIEDIQKKSEKDIDVSNWGIENYLDYGLVHACFKENLEAVRYMLTSNKLSTKANIEYNNNDALIAAINENNSDEIIKYLLTSPELKKHADPHAQAEYLFKTASRENKNLVNFLIWDYQITETELIKVICKNNSVLQKTFKARDLSNKLSTGLQEKESITRLKL